MTYEERLGAIKAPTPDHAKWHKVFGDDCRRAECPMRKERTK